MRESYCVKHGRKCSSLGGIRTSWMSGMNIYAVPLQKTPGVCSEHSKTDTDHMDAARKINNLKPPNYRRVEEAMRHQI